VTGLVLERDGPATYLLADTVWSAFTDAELDEWTSYVDLRAEQGFNGVQVSVLPILHDRTEGPWLERPFADDGHGAFDWTRPREAYFERAARMLEIALARGLAPVVVLVWVNYVPGTWASRRDPHQVLPLERLDAYVSLVAEHLGPLARLVAIAGDTDCASPEAVDHHVATLRAVRRRLPGVATTIHLAPSATLPEVLADAPELDVLSYQSGHRVDRQDLAFLLAERLAAHPRRRPVLNLEPCYEGHGYAGRPGRFDRDDVRKALWASLLAGATSGAGYGAHGLWQWYRPGRGFTRTAVTGLPFAWRDALALPGAWDAVFVRDRVEELGLLELVPRQDLLPDPVPFLRAAATPGGELVVVYLPHAMELTLTPDLSGLPAVAWHLDERRRWHPSLEGDGGRTRVALPPYNGDTLLVLGTPTVDA